MPADLAGLRRDRAKASSRMSEMVTAARSRSMTDDESREFESVSAEVARLDGEISTAEAGAAAASSASIGRAEASEIVKLCVDGGVPGMAAALLAEGVTVEAAKARIAAAAEARNLVALARRKDPSISETFAADLLAEGKTVEQIRTALFDKLVADEKNTSISSHPGAAEKSAKTSWKDAVDKTNTDRSDKK